jgi:CheY-like chemotaxis protein
MVIPHGFVKFTDTGIIDFDVEVLRETEELVRLKYSVTDTGIGVSKDKQDEIFKPFKQADTSTTRRFGGTGLGLSICQKLAKLMDGKVGLESEEGEGSTFWVELNLEKTDKTKSDDLEDESKKISDNQSGSTQIKYKALIVEANPINQTVTVEMLSKLGVATEVADNGEKAVEMANKQNYDVIFMEVNMPIMDGLEATKIIRKNQASEATHVPIIALTTSVSQNDKEKVYSAGMDDFIAKPVTKTALLTTLKKWIPDVGSN